MIAPINQKGQLKNQRYPPITITARSINGWVVNRGGHDERVTENAEMTVAAAKAISGQYQLREVKPQTNKENVTTVARVPNSIRMTVLGIGPPRCPTTVTRAETMPRKMAATNRRITAVLQYHWIDMKPMLTGARPSLARTMFINTLRSVGC
jgi:hypothetical protein